MRLPTLAALVVLLYGTAAKADQISWPSDRVSSPMAISADGPASADPATPDHFTNKAFCLNLTLTDAASGAKGAPTSAGAPNATFSDGTTKNLVLGTHTYTAALDGSTPPTRITTGSFGAQITPACLPPGGPPTQLPPSANAPEPSAFVLAVLGASLAVLTLRRKPQGRAVLP